MAFEINITPITGQITIADIIEVGGVAPTNVINASQGFDAHLEWELCGAMVGILGGNWHVRLLLESMGPDPEHVLPTPVGKTVPLSSGVPCPTNPNCTCWTTNINVGAQGVAPGTYKPVIALTYVDTNGNPGPIAGFAELGMVQIYA
jgi:hypothetical protein